LKRTSAAVGFDLAGYRFALHHLEFTDENGGGPEVQLRKRPTRRRLAVKRHQQATPILIGVSILLGLQKLFRAGLRRVAGS
jgi:hypothetical protein